MKTTAARTRRAPSPASRVSERVADYVERMIFEGGVAAGHRINEAALAEALEVSRAPVREALRCLEGRGLVTRVANRGMFVRELSVKEMLDIFDLRALLMGYGAERATELLNDERRTALAGLLDAMDDATRANDGSRYYLLNHEFHMTVLSYCNNRRALSMYEELAKDLHRFRRHYFDFTPNMMKSNAEHRAMFDAILAGDAAQARRLAEDHVQQGKARVLQTLDEA
jgi:DNA-binding GntR family transcriptional regulator